jgi:hypothetical protein
MKKLLMIFAMLGAFATASYAADGGTAYKANDEKIDQLFASANDITLAATTDQLVKFNNVEMNTAVGSGEKTKGGFLVRAFFCGGFALHRYYMGTGGKQLFWYYFCIPVAGGVVGCVDFWYVLIKGDEVLSKYKDNPDWIVWN